MEWIKKLIGNSVGWTCYYLGHWYSIPMEHFEWIPFEPYRRLMQWSYQINDWAGINIWKAVDSPEPPQEDE
jgi:hypothetical protein